MMYFNNINTFAQAKQEYRKIAKALHPDRGGSLAEFQKMQAEYKSFLLKLQNKELINKSSETKNEIVNEFGKLVNVLIKKQVPQTFLKHRITKSNTTLERSLYSGLIKFLDEFSL